MEAGQHVRLRVNQYIAREKGILSLEVEGSIKATSAKAMLFDGAAVVRESRTCLRCGREITHPTSILVGYGPDCCRYLGIDRPDDISPETLAVIKQQIERESHVTTWLPRSMVTVLECWGDPLPQPDHPVQPKTLSLNQHGGLEFRFGYDPKLVAAVKSIFGARWHPNAKVWTVPPIEADAALDLAQRYGFDVDESAEVLAAEGNKKAEQREMSRALSADLVVPGLGGTLRPFQRAGVAYASQTKRCFLAEEMGLGKTVEALATIEYEGAFPAIVVCPASVKLNWERETRKWLPNHSIEVLGGKLGTYCANITVLNYELLERHLDALKAVEPRAVIADESHYLKTPKAKRTKLMLQLVDGVPIRLLLSGTAILNRPYELVSQLRILNRLHEFGGERAFIRRYCGAYMSQWGMNTSGATRLDELNDRLRSTCLPYDALVTTERGPQSIGRLVEQQRPIGVWSRRADGTLEVRTAVAFSKRVHRESLVRVHHTYGYLDCTPDHQVWTEQGFRRADSLRCGDYLLDLRQASDSTLARGKTNPTEILLPALRRGRESEQPRSFSAINADSRQEARTRPRKGVRVVRQDLPNAKYTAGKSAAVLQSVLLKQLEADATSCGRSASQDVGCAPRPGSHAESRSKDGGGSAGYPTQSREHREGATNLEKKPLQAPTRGPHLPSSTAIMGEIGILREMVGVLRYGAKTEWEVHQGYPKLSLDRHCSSSLQDCHRDRRHNTPLTTSAATGPMEREDTCLTRVDRIEILERGGVGGSGGSRPEDLYVYDIQVEGNNNFFADGILVHNCYIRREKSEVLKELPPKVRSIVPMEISNRKEYTKAETDLIRWLREKGEEEKADKAMQAEHLVRINALKRLTIEGKLQGVIAWIEEFLESGEKLVVAAHHVDVVERLAKHFNAPYINGSVSVAQRQAAVDRFQTMPECQLIVLNTTSGGVGITLTAASNICIIELPWTPALLDQVEDRLHRIGQEDSVTAWYLLAASTIEEDIAALLDSKRSVVTAALVDGKESSEHGLIDELMSRLTERNAA